MIWTPSTASWTMYWQLPSYTSTMLTSLITFLRQPAFRLPLFCCCCIVITIAALSPLEHLPAAPGGDKSHHIIAFALWSMSLWLYPHSSNRYLLLVIITWGGAIELIQPWVNRYGEWLDFWANLLGVAIGLILAVAINRWLDKSVLR